MCCFIGLGTVEDDICGRNARGKVWGSDEVNVEGWKPLKRLPGHESGMWRSTFPNTHSYLIFYQT